MHKEKASTDTLISYILEGIADVKGQDTVLMDLREIENTVCDYFVICTGTSNTHVNALVGSVQKKVSRATKDKPWHVEGSENAEWVLMDYVSVVVHVFQKNVRTYYDIEGLWGDAKFTQIPDGVDQPLQNRS